MFEFITKVVSDFINLSQPVADDFENSQVIIWKMLINKGLNYKRIDLATMWQKSFAADATKYFCTD